MKPQLHRSFRFSYIRDFSFADYLTVPAMLYDAGRKSLFPRLRYAGYTPHIPDLENSSP